MRHMPFPQKWVQIILYLTFSRAAIHYHYHFIIPQKLGNQFIHLFNSVITKLGQAKTFTSTFAKSKCIQNMYWLLTIGIRFLVISLWIEHYSNLSKMRLLMTIDECTNCLENERQGASSSELFIGVTHTSTVFIPCGDTRSTFSQMSN